MSLTQADIGLLIIQLLQKIPPKLILHSEVLSHVVRPTLTFDQPPSQFVRMQCRMLPLRS